MHSLLVETMPSGYFFSGVCVFASSGALYKDIADAVTAVGIYDLRLLQIKRCGRLDPKAVPALDSCPLLLYG